MASASGPSLRPGHDLHAWARAQGAGAKCSSQCSWWLDPRVCMDARLAVASWLDEADLKALSLVNKDSLAFARCDVLWKPLYLRR